MADTLVLTKDELLGFLEWGAEQLEPCAPGHPDLRCVQCGPTRFHDLLMDLARLWCGMRLDTTIHLRRYGQREWQHLDGGDRALHAYALNLAHCFPSTRGTP